MLHLTVGILVAMLVVVWLVGIGMGSAASRKKEEKERRKAEKQQLRVQAKFEREEAWRKKKLALSQKLMPWRRIN